MPPKSESQKQLDALSKQQEQEARSYASPVPAVQDYGVVGSTGVMKRPDHSEYMKDREARMDKHESKQYGDLTYKRRHGK